MGTTELSKGYDKKCLYKIQGSDDEKWIYGEFLKREQIFGGL